MRRYDILVCTFVIAIGLVWFTAAEVVYDGSLMENPFLRSGMFAQCYVPLATMYLVKVIRGEGLGARVVAWMASFMLFWAMIAVDVWVTHFKPNCDICHIPAKECFIMESVMAMIITAVASVSDVISIRLTRMVRPPIVGCWFVRRALRVVGTVLIAWFLSVIAYWVLYVILRMVWFLWKMIV